MGIPWSKFSAVPHLCIVKMGTSNIILKYGLVWESRYWSSVFLLGGGGVQPQGSNNPPTPS